jgi:hypothetical protein
VAGNITVTLVGTSILRISIANPGDAFAATQLAAGDQLIVALVRVNANSAGAGPVTATMSGISFNPATNPITFTEPVRTVGVIFASLTATIPSLGPPAVLTCAPTASVANGSGIGAAALGHFAVTGTEVFPAALANLAQESGFAPAAHAATLAAATAPTTGTTVIVTLSGVPAGFRIVPTAAIQSTTAAPTVAVGAPTLTFGALPANVTQASSASGADITFTYTVTGTSTAAVETFTFGYQIGTPSAAVIAAGGLTGPVTATVSIGPISTTGTVRMAANALGPNTVANISDCVTRLEMSWVVNTAGYDTGIAIANTSNDDAAFGTGVAVGGTDQSGPCVLTGYPAAGGTPISFTTASIPAGQTLAFTISSATGFSGFSGYVLAVCNFLNAHAFLFITDGFGSAAGPGLAQGYQALVVPAGTRVIPGGEVLGH